MEKVQLQNDKNIDELLASITEGKEVKADFFEDIKKISKNGTAIDNSEGVSNEAVPVEPSLFECPVCQTQVREDEKHCPGCGALFAEEVPIEKFECPMCGSEVEASASKCPSCGVEFEEEVVETEPVKPPPRAPPVAEERKALDRIPPTVTTKAPPKTPTARTFRQRIDDLRTMNIEPISVQGLDKKALYKELPKIVNEVKPLLISAKKLGVNIEDSKQLINDAITAGKKKEMENAIKLVSKAKASLEKSFILELAGQVDNLLVEINKARASGSAVAPVEGIIADALSLLEANKYQEASQKISAAREEFEAKAGVYYRARESLETVVALLEDCSILDVELSQAEQAIQRAKDALGQKKWDQTEKEAKKAREYIVLLLPDQLNKEMKNARNMLLDMKIKGGDVTKPIGLLKQVSILLRRAEYENAVHYLRMFHKEIGSI